MLATLLGEAGSLRWPVAVYGEGPHNLQGGCFQLKGHTETAAWRCGEFRGHPNRNHEPAGHRPEQLSDDVTARVPPNFVSE